MTLRFRAGALLWVGLSFLAALGCGPGGTTDALPPGRLVVAVPSEPSTWNALLATDAVSHMIAEQLHAPLVRVNPVTQEIEPVLARTWELSRDGRELLFRLRPDVRFSDGRPFTAGDVAFTFRALHDSEVGSPLAETAKVAGVALKPEVLDPLTVRFSLPSPSAVAVRLFEGIDILPRHRLAAALDEGRFHVAYGVGSPEESIVGLGPFVLDRYQPGQRVVLRRNPHYWKRDSDGARLPRLEGILFEILADPNAAVLRLRSGELDLLDRIGPEDFLSLRGAAAGELRLIDLGPGMASERLWFNHTVRGAARSWFTDRRFRQAVSLAIDRDAILEIAFRGLATSGSGPISPANRWWLNSSLPPIRRDPQRARALLTASGFRWRDGVLEDRLGNPVRFHLITNADNPRRARTAALIQEDLRGLGVDMSFSTLDYPSLVGRISRTRDYDACLLGVTQTDPDPSAELPFWLSRSPMHIWNPSQPAPATEWETRIDELMEALMKAGDDASRKRYFDEVQRILALEVPVINVVFPHALVAARARVRNLEPNPFTHPLWNADELFLDE